MTTLRLFQFPTNMTFDYSIHHVGFFFFLFHPPSWVCIGLHLSLSYSSKRNIQPNVNSSSFPAGIISNSLWCSIKADFLEELNPSVAQSDYYSNYQPQGSGLKEQRSGIIVQIRILSVFPGCIQHVCETSASTLRSQGRISDPESAGALRAAFLHLLPCRGSNSLLLSLPAACQGPFLTPNLEVRELELLWLVRKACTVLSFYRNFY